MQERCRALMRTKPTLGELVKLDADAEELPGIIPEMDALNRCRLIIPLPIGLKWTHKHMPISPEPQGREQEARMFCLLPYLCSRLSVAMCTAQTLHAGHACMLC